MAGRNIGEAYVLDSGTAVGIYGKQLERDRQASLLKAKKAEEENALLVNQMGKINANGLSKPDLPEFNEKLSTIKSAYYKYRGARTDEERMTAKLEVDDLFKDALQYSASAKQSRMELGRLAQTYMANPDKYDDDVKKDIMAELAKPVSQIDFEKVNPLNRQRKVDETKVIASLDKMDGMLLKNADWGTQTRKKGREANISGEYITNIREVPKNAQLERYKLEVSNSPELRSWLSKQYPTLNPDQQISALAEARRGLGFLKEVSTPTFRGNRAPKSSKGGSNANDSQTLIQDIVNGVATKNPNMSQTVQAMLPEGSKVGWNGGSFTVDIPDGITPAGTERFGVSQKFDSNDPNFGAKLATFLSDTDVGKKGTFFQKMYKKGGKPTGKFTPAPKANSAPKSDSKTRTVGTSALGLFKKKK